MEVTLINVGDIIAYGLRCVSSNLKKHGINTKIIFIPRRFSDIAHNNLISDILSLAKDSVFIGISLMIGQLKSAIYLTENLKKMSAIPVCWGGVHPTTCPEDSLRYADMVCIGEAEESAVLLAKRLTSQESLIGLEGVWFKQKKKAVRNPLRGLPQDLNQFPPPDYDFSSQYIFDYAKGKLMPMDEDYFIKHRWRRYTTLPTRGCAMNCTFCVNNYLHRMYPDSYRLRSKSVENLISELKWVKENLKFIRQINFLDDDFMRLPMDYMRDFTQQYRKQIDMPLVVMGISPQNFDRQKLDLLQENIYIEQWRLGIQSGSYRTRSEIFNRRHSDEKLMEIVNYFSRYRKRSQVIYDIVLENPWETEAGRVETFNFLMKIPKPFRLFIYYLTFYPGTSLYERAKKEGLLNSGNDGFSKKYQLPQKKDKLNKIIASIDNMPGWFVRILFITRKIPFISDALLLIRDFAAFMQARRKRTLSKLIILKKRILGR